MKVSRRFCAGRMLLKETVLVFADEFMLRQKLKKLISDESFKYLTCCTCEGYGPIVFNIGG